MDKEMGKRGEGVGGGRDGKEGGGSGWMRIKEARHKMDYVLLAVHLRVNAFSKSPWRLLVSPPPTLRSGAHMSAQSVFS